MVHRDIKLDNILVKKIEDQESFDVKVADFGLARFMPFEEAKSSNKITRSPIKQKIFQKCGTPCYIAPEIFCDKGYDEKCDLFSCGVVLFNIITGLYLF